jgi:hypothetical protein
LNGAQLPSSALVSAWGREFHALVDHAWYRCAVES